MDQQTLQQFLSDTGISEVQYYPATGSTNTDAMQWLETGAPDFSLVVADKQTAGRGRFKRKWVTNPGAALAFSLALRAKPSEMAFIQLFSPLAGIAVSAALERLLHLTPQIKWPNDILLDGQKTCGILSETAWMDNQLAGIVVGIGINITPASIPPAEMLTFPATCLEEETGNTVDRWQILKEVMHQFAGWRNKLATEEFFTYWQKHLAYAGEEVEIRGTAGAEVTGRLIGIDPSGELVLETESGEVSIQVGDVHLRLRSS